MEKTKNNIGYLFWIIVLGIVIFVIDLEALIKGDLEMFFGSIIKIVVMIVAIYLGMRYGLRGKKQKKKRGKKEIHKQNR